MASKMNGQTSFFNKAFVAKVADIWLLHIDMSILDVDPKSSFPSVGFAAACERTFI